MGTSRVHTEDDLLAAPQVKVEKRSPLQMGTKWPLKHPNKSQRYKRTDQSLNDARKTKGKKKEAAQAATKQHCASPWTWTSKQTPRHSMAREERHAHSLGETRGGSVAAWTFFLKEKPDGLHDDWVNLTENEGWSSATMRLWVTLLLWAPWCSNA